MATIGSSLPDPTLRVKETCVGKRGKFTFRELMSTLDARLSKVEVTIGEMRNYLDV